MNCPYFRKEKTSCTHPFSENNFCEGTKCKIRLFKIDDDIKDDFKMLEYVLLHLAKETNKSYTVYTGEGDKKEFFMGVSSRLETEE